METRDFYSCLSQTVNKMGGDQFGESLIEAVNCLLPFENASIFTLGTRNAKPLWLATRSINRRVEEASNLYFDKYFDKCPYLGRYLSRSNLESFYIKQVRRAEIRHADFRKDMFDSIGVDYHVAILSRFGHGYLYMGLTRSKKQDIFTDEDKEQLKQFWPFLESAVLKNVQMINVLELKPSRELRPASAIISMFVNKGLSPREAEVCSYAVSGFSALATSHAMNIATNTVSTLRQRAYFKLNISSHSELYAYCIRYIEETMYENDDLPLPKRPTPDAAPCDAAIRTARINRRDSKDSQLG